MKKIKTVVLILALFMCFNGCERNQPDDVSSANGDELTIEQAKVLVEMQKMNDFPIKSGKVEKQRIKIRADWKKAKTSSNSDVSVVETDLEAMGGFGFATQASVDAWNSTKNNQYLGSMSRLVVIRLKKTKQEFSFIMTIVADKPYLESKQFDLTGNFYLERVKDLTGYVLYHKLNGDFVNGWEYCDGKIINSLSDTGGTDLPVDLKSAQYTVPIYSWQTLCVDHYFEATCGGASGPRTYSYTSCTEVYTYLGGMYYPDSYAGGYTGGGGVAIPTCSCTNLCSICGKCITTLKSASLPPDGTTTSDPCEYCTCPPANPIPSISSLASPFGIVAKKTAKDVYYFIGGNVLVNYQSNPTAFSNACALRLSYTLNSIPGSEIPFIEGKTLSGDVNRDGIKEWYFYRVSDMVDYLNRTFGSCTLTDTNHIVGMTGIIWQSDCGWDDASGHIDIWNRNNALGHYYDQCSVVYIWRN